MNVWSVRNVMSENKTRSSSPKSSKRAFVYASLLTFLLAPALASAQSAPGLSAVSEVVVLNTRLVNPETSQKCGILPQNVTKDMAKFAKEYGTPAVSLLEAKPTKIGSARVDIVTEVTTLYTQTGDCISYVGATAQSKNILVVPPIRVPRNVIITYWKNGLLVTSTEPAHSRLVQDVIDKLARSFAEQYKIDQPPDLSNLTEPMPAEDDSKK